MRSKHPLQKIVRLVITIMVLAALPLGIAILDKKLNPDRGIASSGDASPNPDTNSSDLSHLSDEEFHRAFKYQILKDADFYKQDGKMGISLSSFMLKGESGGRVFVCEKYPLYDMIFAAEGVAISGEIPKMIVRGPCLISDDQAHIEPLTIPYEEILESPITQSEFTVPYAERDHVKIFFRNTVETWPTQWNWIGIKFYGNNPEETLEMNGYEIISVLGEPLTIGF